MLELKVINLETNKVEKISLKSNSIGGSLVGRDPSCHLVLYDSQVSKIHGMFVQSANTWYYQDLLPTNPSSLNNTKIELNAPQALKVRDSIYIGDSWLVVQDIKDVESKNGKVTGDNLTVSCIGIIEETSDVKTFRFATNPLTLFDYKPGTFATLNLNINGESIYRSYTISSTPSRPHTLEITVKRVPAPSNILNAPSGVVSNWLHENLKLGDEIEISQPMGDFTCIDRTDRKLLLISAGSGITPMMSMSRWAYDSNLDLDIIFFHSARKFSDVIFQKELSWMADRNPKFNLHISLTQEEAGSSWSGLRGRLDAEMLEEIADDFKDRAVYICGSDGFMQGVENTLENLDFPMENYHQESFGSFLPAQTLIQPKKIQSSLLEKSNKSSVVVFSKSGIEVEHNSEQSILELGKLENIPLKSACKRGVCGVCKLTKIEGNIEYKGSPSALTSSEQEAGSILSCIAYPLGRVEIEA